MFLDCSWSLCLLSVRVPLSRHQNRSLDSVSCLSSPTDQHSVWHGSVRVCLASPVILSCRLCCEDDSGDTNDRTTVAQRYQNAFLLGWIPKNWKRMFFCKGQELRRKLIVVDDGGKIHSRDLAPWRNEILKNTRVQWELQERKHLLGSLGRWELEKGDVS